MNIDRGMSIGCDSCFCFAFNSKFALLLIPSFISPNQHKVRGGRRVQNALKLFSKSYKVHKIW